MGPALKNIAALSYHQLAPNELFLKDSVRDIFPKALEELVVYQKESPPEDLLLCIFTVGLVKRGELQLAMAVKDENRLNHGWARWTR
ncbi:hypothetical protein TREES_T100006229 [Tupaia chinensis]|uniref:Uncharacterized protein n=1 Tax=Tupaia chinensis TaxID=246437 RepID=L9L8N0_TUPCH|nr:hypothetical protein TREES_T100006229 [Tupaia chinensis]